jgi:glucose-1-phosphate thymidylyltransferase
MAIIGLIPACGKAERLSPLPCSKEIFPIGLQASEYSGKVFPKVMSDHLLEYYQEAGVHNVYFIIRSDKQDIPKYFAQRKDIELDIRFLEMDHSPGAPFTLDSAFPIVKNHITALGYPDILIKPSNAYKAVLQKLLNADIDIALGLFPIERKYSWDMVEIKEGAIKKIVIKSPDTKLDFGWTIAIWKPAFASFMHEYLKKLPLPLSSEIYVGHVIQAAIDDGMKTGYVLFDKGACIDLGKPEDLSVIYREW